MPRVSEAADPHRSVVRVTANAYLPGPLLCPLELHALSSAACSELSGVGLSTGTARCWSPGHASLAVCEASGDVHEAFIDCSVVVRQLDSDIVAAPVDCNAGGICLTAFSLARGPRTAPSGQVYSPWT
jgi:hypothetical protein